MSSNPPQAWRVRLEGGRVVPVGDLEILDGLARAGVVGADTPVAAPGSDAWRPASAVPELASALGLDPWSAWDALDDDSAESVPFTVPAELDAQGLADAPALEQAPAPLEEDVDEEPTDPGLPVVPPPPPPRSGPRFQIDARPRARAATPPPASPPVPEVGKVIAFPAERSARVQGSHALADAPPDPLPPARPRPRPAATGVPTFRWWRVVALVTAAGCALLLLRWYVTATATQVMARGGEPIGTLAQPPPDPLAPSADLPPPPDPAAAAADPNAVYESLEEEIRGQMRADILDVRRPGDLQDALFIALSKVRVDVVSVDAPVVTWAGRLADAPEVAEIRIRFRSRAGELDRELAAIGLISGQYIQHYRLDVPHFEVTVEGVGGSTRRLALDPEMARRVYTRRMSLLDFLRSTTSSTAPG